MLDLILNFCLRLPRDLSIYEAPLAADDCRLDLCFIYGRWLAASISWVISIPLLVNFIFICCSWCSRRRVAARRHRSKWRLWVFSSRGYNSEWKTRVGAAAAAEWCAQRTESTARHPQELGWKNNGDGNFYRRRSVFVLFLSFSRSVYRTSLQAFFRLWAVSMGHHQDLGGRRRRFSPIGVWTIFLRERCYPWTFFPATCGS